MCIRPASTAIVSNEFSLIHRNAEKNSFLHWRNEAISNGEGISSVASMPANAVTRV